MADGTPGPRPEPVIVAVCLRDVRCGACLLCSFAGRYEHGEPVPVEEEE